MSRRLIGRIVGDRYIRIEDEDAVGAPSVNVRFGPERDDYFAGVRPSQLSTLDNRQLYQAASRLFEHRHTGTSEERARAAEVYNAIVHEARARRATLHD